MKVGYRRLSRATILVVVSLLSQPLLAEELSVPGSGNPEYMLTIFAGAFNKAQSAHRVSVPPSTGTAGAIRDVEAGTASLGRVGRKLKPDELARGLVYLPIGQDPVTFVAGAGTTIAGLTARQAADIYSGKITNWQDLGGKPGPIRAIGREETDASRTAITRGLKEFQGIVLGEQVKVVHLDPQLIELLDRFPGSLGFLNRSALSAARTKLVHLTLDGVAATPDAVERGQYPLWLELGLIYRLGNLTPAGKAFIAFIQSPASMQIRADLGLLVGTAPAQAR